MLSYNFPGVPDMEAGTDVARVTVFSVIYLVTGVAGSTVGLSGGRWHRRQPDPGHWETQVSVITARRKSTRLLRELSS